MWQFWKVLIEKLHFFVQGTCIFRYFKLLVQVKLKVHIISTYNKGSRVWWRHKVQDQRHEWETTEKERVQKQVLRGPMVRWTYKDACHTIEEQSPRSMYSGHFAIPPRGGGAFPLKYVASMVYTGSWGGRSTNPYKHIYFQNNTGSL